MSSLFPRRFEFLSPVPQTEPLRPLARPRLNGAVLLFAALAVLGLCVPRSALAQFQQREIATDSYGNVVTADVDGDGSPDVLTSNFDHKEEEGAVVLGESSGSEEKDIAVSWFENTTGESGTDGNGFFGAERVIVAMSELPSAHAGDFDGDGNRDALSVTPDNGTIAWYENRVGESETDADGFGEQCVLTTDAYGVTSVQMADVDGDGRVDVLVSFSEHSRHGIRGGDRIVWYENQIGEADADDDGFRDSTIAVSHGAKEMVATDVDGDGSEDVLLRFEDRDGDDRVAWAKNQIGKTGTEAFHDLQAITKGKIEPKTMHATDVDVDGDPDLLLSSSDEVAWYENQVGESGDDADGFGSKQVVFTFQDARRCSPSHPCSIFSADVDGDGDEDALTAFEKRIAWYENQIDEGGADTSGFGPQRLVATHEVKSIHAGDVDGDGDDDILASWHEGIVWHESQVDGTAGAGTAAYRKAETAYEDERWEDALTHLDRAEEILSGRSGSTVDSLRSLASILRTKSLLRVSEHSYYNEFGMTHETADYLDRLRAILARQHGPQIDTLRARRFALLARIRYEEEDLGGAQWAHVKMAATGAVPPDLAEKMATHRRKVEAALMKKLPQAVQESIRTDATVDTLDLSDHDLTGLPNSIGRITPRHRVDLSSNELKFLPESIRQWTRLRELDLSENELKRFPDGLLHLTRLQTLDLSVNWWLKEVPEDIGRLTRLRRLNLADTGLERVPASIGRLTRLRRLDVSGNDLSELPSSLWQLSTLRRLNLSDTGLQNLPEGIGQLTSLTRLNVAYNALTELPSDFGEFTSLRRVDLSGNELKTLPSSIGQLISLRRLDVSHNALSELPSSIGQGANLQRLDLSGNGVTSLPSSIGQLTRLRRLSLSNSDLASPGLTELPPSVAQLTSLRRLDVSGNSLTAFPSSMDPFTSLRRVDLSGNELKMLPSSIGQLISLRRLDVSHNALSELPSSIGQGANLQRLDLSGNGVKSLPSSIGQLTRLRRLSVSNSDLASTGLTELPPSFNQLTRLRRLDVSGNSLTAFPSSMDPFTSLRRLNLAYNDLKSLPSGVEQLPNLKVLSVSGASVPSDAQNTRLQSLLSDGTTVTYTQPLINEANYRWLQTAQLLVPVGRNFGREDNVPKAVLNSFTSVLARRDSLSARRRPLQSEERSFSVFTDQLETAAGIDPMDANYVRIEYQFGVGPRGFEEKIQAIHFLYRANSEQEFVPVLYLNGQQSWVQSVLRREGVRSRGHPHRPVSFAEVLQFVNNQEAGTILRIGGRDVRGDPQEEIKAFIEKVKRLTYEKNR